MSSSSSKKSFETDVKALRTACSVIDFILADIKRDYAQLEDEHLKFVTHYKLLSDQAKLTEDTARRPTPKAPSDLFDPADFADLDEVAAEVAKAEIPDGTSRPDDNSSSKINDRLESCNLKMLIADCLSDSGWSHTPGKS